MAAAFLQSFQVALTGPELSELDDMNSDLRFMLAENEVEDRVALRLVRIGLKSIATFAVGADDRPGFRASMVADVVDPGALGLTAAEITIARTTVTKLVAAWLIASQRVIEETRINVDTRSLRLPAVLNRVSLIALRQRYEREHGRVSDAIWPCAALVERRLEEAEEGSFEAPSLTEVISLDLCSDEGTHQRFSQNSCTCWDYWSFHQPRRSNYYGASFKQKEEA